MRSLFITRAASSVSVSSRTSASSRAMRLSLSMVVSFELGRALFELVE